MPFCFCRAHGCSERGGVDAAGKPKGFKVDTKTLKLHTIEDKKSALEIAECNADAAVEAQIEEITSYLASSVLADDVSGSSSQAGGSLWSRSYENVRTSTRPDARSCAPKDSDIPNSRTRHNPPRQAGSRRSVEAGIIATLSNLEAEVNTFTNDYASRLQKLGVPPSGAPTPFPLSDLLDRSGELFDQLNVITYKSAAVLVIHDSIHRKLQLAEHKLTEAKVEWAAKLAEIKAKKEPKHGTLYDTSHHFLSILPSVDPVLQVTLFLVVTCQVLLGVSRRGAMLMLNMIQYIIHLSLVRHGPNLSPQDRKLLSDIPIDPRAGAKAFALETKSVIYAVCPNPNCHCTYKPTFEKDSPIPRYPKTCNYREFRGGRKCNTPLLKPRRVDGQIIEIPIKPFVAFSFKDWLAGILSRPGFEKKMDRSWESCMQDRQATDEMKDIFDGEILRNFKGLDGQHFSAGGEEGRYVFSLCVDYFNPLGNKQAGKKKSIGLISMVCLNLPPEMRYKPENMFLFGIVPGPNEPPLACLNHYLCPLVDELLEFWVSGVQFSRTSDYYHGRVVRAALICLVSDLPAARKTNGFAAIGHTQMCAMCDCKRPSAGNNDVYAHLGNRRTGESIRNSARRYQDAGSEKERVEIVKETGIRWSELYRLPYFDPSRAAVVDAMHNLFLGLIQEHFEILGIRMDKKKADNIIPSFDIDIPEELMATLDPNSRKSVDRLVGLLQSPLSKSLKLESGYESYFAKFNQYHREALKLVYDYLKISFKPQPNKIHDKKVKMYKADYVRSILAWRAEQIERPAKFSKGGILTATEISQLRSDIANMATPSWLTSVPTNLGEPSHGKLKADQWRCLGITYLPVALLRLWAKLGDDERSIRCKKLLSATMSLVSAVTIASSRTTSCEKADLYLHHMQDYLKAIRDIFPNYKYLPNQHMALHLAEYLRLYGPVHAWWTFPFERLIGMLQRIPNNFQDGQLEETISNSFTKSANLRSLLLKDGCPVAIKNCEGYFTKFVDPQIRNTLLTDIARFSSVLEDAASNTSDVITTHSKSRKIVISGATHQALRTYYADIGVGKVPDVEKIISSYTATGLTFSSSTKHAGNSLVLLCSPSQGSSVPAQIENIIQVSSTEVLFAVRYFLKTTADDPFKQYPIIQTSLWSEHCGSLAIAKLEDVDAHFACLKFEWNSAPCIAAISLSREY